VQRQISAEAADEFLLAKHSVGMVRESGMVMSNGNRQSLQSGGNFLWEVSVWRSSSQGYQKRLSQNGERRLR